MSDLKSKLPDMNEMTTFASKFFNDVKQSVCEIVDAYKAKRSVTTTETVTVVKKTTKKDSSTKESSSGKEG